MSRPDLFRQELSKRILILDGGMGTMLQRQNLTAADFGGEAYEGCNEYLTVTKPSAMGSVHEQYLKAGADIVETCTFGGTPMVLDEYGLGKDAFEINRLRNSHNKISVYRIRFRKCFSCQNSGMVYTYTIDCTVCSCKINILKNTSCLLLRRDCHRFI